MAVETNSQQVQGVPTRGRHLSGASCRPELKEVATKTKQKHMESSLTLLQVHCMDDPVNTGLMPYKTSPCQPAFSC